MRSHLLILVFGLTLLPGSSEALVKNDFLGEISVAVEGVTRTKPLFVESLVRNCLKRGGYRTWQSVDPMAMGQCLSNTRLFSSVSVLVREPEIIVRISDRWTLIPIPNIYASDGKRSAGVFVYESNFLGYGKTLGAGGALSSEGNSFSLMYMDHAVNFSDYTVKIFVARSSDDNQAYDQKNVVYGYNKVAESLTLSPGYRLSPSLKCSLSLNYSNKEFSQLDLFAPPADYRAWSGGAGISYRKSDYKLFYNDGLSTRLDWTSQMQRSDHKEKITSLSASLAWDKLLFVNHALQLGLRGAHQSEATGGDINMYGRGNGYRGIQPQGLWTSRIISASADYQIPIATWQHGTLTVAPFVDYGVYKSYFDDSDDDYLAGGIGAYYFMNFINMPGLGVTVGMNEDFMGGYIAIQIGTGFH